MEKYVVKVRSENVQQFYNYRRRSHLELILNQNVLVTFWDLHCTAETIHDLYTYPGSYLRPQARSRGIVQKRGPQTCYLYNSSGIWLVARKPVFIIYMHVKIISGTRGMYLPSRDRISVVTCHHYCTDHERSSYNYIQCSSTTHMYKVSADIWLSTSLEVLCEMF